MISATCKTRWFISTTRYLHILLSEKENTNFPQTKIQKITYQLLLFKLITNNTPNSGFRSFYFNVLKLFQLRLNVTYYSNVTGEEGICFILRRTIYSENWEWEPTRHLSVFLVFFLVITPCLASYQLQIHRHP